MTDHPRTPADIMGELLRRWRHGLVRPLWEDLSEERKAPWIREGETFIAKAKEAGLMIEAMEDSRGR